VRDSEPHQVAGDQDRVRAKTPIPLDQGAFRGRTRRVRAISETRNSGKAGSPDVARAASGAGHRTSGHFSALLGRLLIWVCGAMHWSDNRAVASSRPDSHREDPNCLSQTCVGERQRVATRMPYE
jgi:hypothetical protein